MEVVVYGSGCSKCHSTTAMLERVASELGIALELSSNQSPQDRARLGIAATPAVAVDG